MTHLPVVLDNGTGFIKCGYAGTHFPTTAFQTAVGRPILRSGQKHATTKEIKDVMRGDETNEIGHLLEMKYPIANGVIRDMDEMCLLWDYTFHEKMAIDPKNHDLMLSEIPMFSNRHRSKVYEVMFERYGFQSIQSAAQGILSLYSNGLDTGVAVECGEGVIHCTPIFEGYEVPKANKRVDIGGRNITEFLVRLMQRRGYSFNKSSDFETVRVMKEMFCYAACDPLLEKTLALETTTLEKTFTLPDGSLCRIGQERFEATEALFQPHLMGVESEGLSHQVWNCIQAADVDLRARLYEHVVLSGGSTMFPGLSSRLERDMKEFFVERAVRGDRSKLGRFKLRIEDSPRRKYMVYLGASTLAILKDSTPDSWMTKQEWEESGESGVRARFGGV